MGCLFKSCSEKFIQKASVLDIGLLKISCVVFGIFLASLFPPLIEFNPWLLLIIALILVIKPVLTIFKK